MRPVFDAPEQRLQSGLPRLEREAIDALTVQVNQIEGEVHESLARWTAGYGLLHRLEAAAAVRKHHDQFAVDQRVLHAECADRFGDLGKLRRPVESFSADQTDAAARIRQPTR